MIKYNHLLSNSQNMFWKTILERISIGDAPFFTTIDKGVFMGLDLKRADSLQIINVCREKWDIPEPYNQWKDIKKECVRSFLIYNYVATLEKNFMKRRDLTIKISDLLSSKKLKNEDIDIKNGKIVHISL
jgi:hypothetical protein